MFYPSLVLTLAAAAAAIDIRMRPDFQGCAWSGGGWVGCGNLNPNVCCRPPAGMQTLWIAAIPNGWNIQAQAWFDSGCSNRSPVLQGGWKVGPDLCEHTGGNDMRGSSYAFQGRKRGADASSGCQDVDTFVLADGTTQYNVTGLLPAAIFELVSRVLQSELMLERFTNTL